MLGVALDREAQHAVAAVVAEVVDVGADEFGDAQPAEQQHRDDRRGACGLRAGVGVGGREVTEPALRKIVESATCNELTGDEAVAAIRRHVQG